ncbi:hypothetical protein J6590_028701 [Homalodisca vitripennis]|nr:hypothetical protein J6590_028701 [Homalodisca vitripennis]
MERIKINKARMYKGIRSSHVYWSGICLRGEQVAFAINGNSKEEPANESCSSLADEINRSILHENNGLRQELHNVKNKNSFYVLELEDKVKEYEENMESSKKIFDERENELLKQIKSMENRLKSEKEAKNNLILQVEEETNKNDSLKYNQYSICGSCEIYKEETAKMLDTIRTLESIIKILEKEGSDKQKMVNQLELRKSTCLNCFPPLHENNNKRTLPDADQWRKVPTTSLNRNKHVSTRKEATGLDIVSRNPFEVLQDVSLITKESECAVVPNKVSASKRQQTHAMESATSKAIQSTQQEKRQHTSYNRKYKERKQSLLLCADSHGRNVTFHLNKHMKSFNCVGFVRPGRLAEQILNFHNIDAEKLGPDDALIIACGSNDVARDEADGAINVIDKTLEKYNSLKIVLADLPIRHDLKEWSCVNKEIRKCNKSLEALSHKYPNVSLVKIGLADRHFHTQHGMHLNNSGKNWLAGQICEALVRRTGTESSTINGTYNSQGSAVQLPSERGEGGSGTYEGALCNETDSTARYLCTTDNPLSSGQPAAGEEEKTFVGNDLSSHQALPP